MTTHNSSMNLTDAQIHFPKDKNRIRTRKDALLDLLSDGEWHPNYECSRVGGISFHCALYTLRREGWVIESRRVFGGVWEFRLLGRNPTKSDTLPTLSRPQRSVAEEFQIAIGKEYGQTGLTRVRQQLAPWLKEHLTESDASLGATA